MSVLFAFDPNSQADIKPPTYHRQRLLLFLLEQANGTLSRLDLQKLLFLYVQESDAKHYAFVPYRFGCYSFLAADDLDLLHKRDWITLSGKEISLKRSLREQRWAVNSEERQTVRRWMAKNIKRGSELIRHVYRLHPWYAIQSEIKENILNPDELERVHQAKTSEAKTEQTLFTLGYEGIHFEAYVNKLIRNNVKLLCDVRRNPLSRKFGFSRQNLSTLLPKMGIQYQHLPELGIESESRKQLNSMSDYEALFAKYRKTLPNKASGLKRVMDMLDEQKRIALTCFEKEPHYCHRHCVSDFLAKRHGLSVVHL
jgi:uncharacterized protein (DUF488 family)